MTGLIGDVTLSPENYTHKWRKQNQGKTMILICDFCESLIAVAKVRDHGIDIKQYFIRPLGKQGAGLTHYGHLHKSSLLWLNAKTHYQFVQ